MMRVLALMALLVLQNPQEPYPGQSQHQEPPAGWVCMNQNFELSVPKEHVCRCERMKKEDGSIVEDPSCTVFCHADHCACAMGDATKPERPQ
jgi:hypothetical protein